MSRTTDVSVYRGCCMGAVGSIRSVPATTEPGPNRPNQSRKARQDARATSPPCVSGAKRHAECNCCDKVQHDCQLLRTSTAPDDLKSAPDSPLRRRRTGRSVPKRWACPTSGGQGRPPSVGGKVPPYTYTPWGYSRLCCELLSSLATKRFRLTATNSSMTVRQPGQPPKWRQALISAGVWRPTLPGPR